MKAKLLILLLIGAVFISGCVQTEQSEVEKAKTECIKECQAALNSRIDLSNGPCLSNEIIKNWVCDVAHEPRQAADNLPENQCEAWQKTAFHFVEVTPECEFIKAV